jgi:hypothetical protein
MISNITGSIDREVTPCQERLTAIAGRWLSLAATPTFAIMAFLTNVPGGPPSVLCAAPHASMPNGMVSMYMLMSVFHSAPWLKLISGRRSRGRQS